MHMSITSTCRGIHVCQNTLWIIDRLGPIIFRNWLLHRINEYSLSHTVTNFKTTDFVRVQTMCNGQMRLDRQLCNVYNLRMSNCVIGSTVLRT